RDPRRGPHRGSASAKTRAAGESPRSVRTGNCRSSAALDFVQLFQEVEQIIRNRFVDDAVVKLSEVVHDRCALARPGAAPRSLAPGLRVAHGILANVFRARALPRITSFRLHAQSTPLEKAFQTGDTDRDIVRTANDRGTNARCRRWFHI